MESVAVKALEENGEAATQAGSHPYSLTTTILYDSHHPTLEEENTDLSIAVPDGDVKDLEAILPAGVIVDLLGVERCSEAQLAVESCPPSSQIGIVTLDSGLNPLQAEQGTARVYNIAPSSSDIPGEIGFALEGFHVIVHIVGNVNTGGNDAIVAKVSNISQRAVLDGVTLTLWGDPSAASHDSERCYPVLNPPSPCDVVVPPVDRPFLTLPTSCASQPGASASADSWQEPGVFTPFVESPPLPVMSGCEKLGFTPSLEVRPESAVADSPTGVSVVLKVPQLESAGSLAEAGLREAVVTLPSGLSVSPSAVGGLGACSEAQIALASAVVPSCPESSKIASVEAVTPLLENKLVGSVYLAQQGNAGAAQGSNPFHSLLALYLVVEGSGVLIKAPGEVSLNESTGQLTTRFGKDPLTGVYLPQLPYSELKLNFFGGPRAPLVPAVCGSYTTTSQLTPYSAPQSGPPVTPQSTFQVSAGCATGAFAPTMTAGTTSNQAGGYSPFVVTFAREDGEQELGAIQVHTPPGLLGSISHVPLCPEPQAEQGACGAESEIGEVSAAVGPGPDPFYVTGGHAYLTGPYKDAPFGLSFVVPAQGGPFNLGDVVVRAAISIDPHTAALTITSNPLPTILQGVPLQVRSVTVNVNRPEFMFNPTSCTPNTISATLQGSLGTTTTDTVPYQAGDCAALAFAPKFSVTTSGVTSKAGGASLDVKLAYPALPQGSQANIAKVKVDLPKQLPSRLTTLQQACPAATFEANPASCPTNSVIGIAKATTPLLPVTLSGPAYFVSYGGAKFPELIIVLQGDGVRVDLHGETFISKTGITSSTFRAIPDVPVATFELYLPEGHYSALAANGNLCTTNLTMPTAFTAQNGTQLKQTTKLTATNCPKSKTPRKANKATRARRGDGGRGRQSR